MFLSRMNAHALSIHCTGDIAPGAAGPRRDLQPFGKPALAHDRLRPERRRQNSRPAHGQRHVSLDPVSDAKFRDPAFTMQYLEELKTRVFAFCQAMKPDPIYGNMKQSEISFLEFQRKGDISARYDFKGGRWIRVENRISDRYAQAEFDRKNKEDKKKDDDRKGDELRRRLQELGQAFRDDHQGVVLTSPDRVSVNPFVHLHRLVAVHARFDRMLSADTASFGGFFSRVVLYGVPTDRFVDPQQEALIVFQLDEVTPPDALPRGRNLVEEGRRAVFEERAAAHARRPVRRRPGLLHDRLPFLRAGNPRAKDRGQGLSPR